MEMLCPRCWGADSARCGCCEGTSHVPDEQLSTHFRLGELVASPLAVRRAIPNDPPPDVVARLRELAVELLEPLRAVVGPLYVTSGYRSPALNAALAGASTTSAHPEGNAADVVPMGVGLGTAFRALLASPLRFDQAIYEGTWLHLGWRKSGVAHQRRQALQMFGAYEDYNPLDPRTR